jgi:hypothetical protein
MYYFFTKNGLGYILGNSFANSRVAKWIVFKPKIPILVNFEGLAVENLGLFYDHLVYFMAIWYILR